MSTKFTDNVTPVCADWLNQVDQVVYEVLKSATTIEEARAALGVAEEAPLDGKSYLRRNGSWITPYEAPELQILVLYLGAFPAAPVSGWNGAPLVVGMMYYDTTLGVGRVFSGTGWLNFTDTIGGVTIQNYSANRWLMSIVEAPDGSRTVFTMQDQGGTPLNIQNNEHVEVFVDGHMQQPGVDYTVSGSVLTFAEAPLATSNLWGIWIDDDGDMVP